jgi:hypothetical protein
MAINNLVVQAHVVTSRSPEAVFTSLTNAPPLQWIESPWKTRTDKPLSPDSRIAWNLNGRSNILTSVSLDANRTIRWEGGGISGEIAITEGDGKTQVSFSGAFPMSGGGMSGLLFGAAMKGKMSRLASEETQSRLQRLIA